MQEFGDIERLILIRQSVMAYYNWKLFLKKSQRKEHDSTREIAENLLFHLRVVSARGERFRSS